MNDDCKVCTERLERLIEIFWLKIQTMTLAMIEFDRLQDEQRDLLEETRESLEAAQAGALQAHIHNKVDAHLEKQQAREARRVQFKKKEAGHAGLSFQ
jgi:hypothetical protein